MSSVDILIESWLCLSMCAEAPQILGTDALYQLGRVEEAYRLLLAIGPTTP
jgi:hypothetical protein